MSRTEELDASARQSGRWLQRGHTLLQELRARVELGLLVALLLIVAGIWLFANLSSEVLEGDTTAFDRRVMLALRSPRNPAIGLGPAWAPEVMRDITALGSGAILTLVTAGVAIYLMLIRRWTMAWLVIVAVGGGMLLNLGLKALFERPRPDLFPAYTKLYFASFPSGHAMLSATVFLTLGALLARLQTKRRLAAYVMGVSILLTVLVGISRVYLGAHWPTDVLAGWVAGAVWAVLCSAGVWWLQQHWLARRERSALADLDPDSTEEERNVRHAQAAQKTQAKP
jgi:undecaprenyl-diphosphatase